MCVCVFVYVGGGEGYRYRLQSNDVWHHLYQFAKRSAASSMESVVIMYQETDHIWRCPVMQESHLKSSLQADE